MIRTVKKPEQRRQEIIFAAKALFQEKQYEKTTMQDLIDHLGIAKGTIYHYFKSKEELLVAVIEHTVDEYVAGMQQILDESQGSGLDRMRILIISGNVEADQGEIMEHLHSPGNIGMHTRQLAYMISRLAPLYEHVIRQGCEEGIFKTEHPQASAEFLLAGIQFLTDVGVYPWSQDDLVRRAVAFPALIEAQLQAPKGSFNFLLDQM